MATDTLNGRNIVFPIYNENGTPFHNLVLHKSVVDSIVMSLGDKITGEAYYRNNSLNLTMLEYIVYNGVKYTLVNPPTIIREGLVNDNSELKGMTKYSFEFYHPMYQLSNFPFTDVATKTGEEKYLSQNKSFSWIGKPQDYIDKLNKNLEGTQWYVRKSSKFPQDKDNELSEVLTFDNVTIADAIKTGYETWDIPYIVSEVSKSDPLYAQNKRFVVEYGLPSNKIYASEADRQTDNPYVFRFGQGVGLKNNSRTPRNNKIITRLAGYGSEKNIPYGYPQIVWDGAEDDPRLHYPLYDGIVGGRYVKLIQHPFTRNHLMPSVYTDAVNKKVNPNATGYNPNIELKDYYDAVGVDYPNQINPLAPSYEIHEFEDIKPEMDDGTSNVEILGAIPLNADLTPASEWVDDIDGDGNFVQSFFQITLPQLAFDLYACAAITQEMQINMRSGDCIGCTFPIQVDWDDYKLNFYDENGDFAPDGSQRDLSKYPKSNLGSINVIVQKENSTFGTIMPNIYQQPQSGDEFVILGISLPLEYITSAEQRLDEAMQSFLLENNVYYYDYPLKFDEHFLATHTYILEQIRPNSIIHFDYGGVEQQLFVKQLTVKYGNAPLPQYDITLTDNIEVVLNQIGQVAEDVEKLSSILSILRQSYNRNVWTELAKKLSKVSDDTAQGFIRFIQGLQVGNQFVTGLLGEGGVFRKEADGTTYLEADKMYIRIKAYFDNVEIRDYKHSAGNRIASPAGAKCCRVEYIDANGNVTTNVANAVKFRCYFRGSDGEDEVRNNFVVGDQAYCHITSVDTKDDDPNSKSLNMKHYWRLIVGRNTTNVLTENGEHWIDLSNRATETLTIDGTTYMHAGYQSGSDVPAAQDDIIQLGNINDTDRMGAIIEFVTGADAPSYQIFQGINDFNLNGKNYIGLGYSTQTGRAYLNVYGDAYIGDKPDAQGNARSYLKYNAANRQLSIKARIDASSTIDGTEIDEYIAQHSSDWTEEEINALIHDVTDDIQDQIDGAIDTWFYNGTPSDSVLPESEWKAIDIAVGNNNERLRHLGDIYYDNETGYAYRYSNTGTESSPVFVWNPITDSAVVEALRKASQAQDTADGKRTIYGVWNAWMKDGSNILEEGDLFIPQSTTTQGGVTYEANKVYKCTTKGSATFQEVAYTDDSAFNGYISAILNGSGSSGDAATVAAAQKAIKDALGGGTTVDGGLLLTSLIAMRKYKGSGSTTDIANYDTWAGISGLRKDTETGSGWKGYGIAAWYGGSMVDHEVSTTATDYAKSLFRFDGSGYLAGGNISWDKNGIVTIANVYSNVNGQNVEWSGTTLQYMNNLSNSLPLTYQSGVAYFDPRLSFTNLSIMGKAVATQEWIGQNYISIAFFNRLFRAYNGSMQVNPNNTTSTIDNIKAMFGFWTQQYISALGQGSDGGATIQTLAQLNDVSISNVSDGQVLVYDSTSNKWKNGVGTGVDMTAVWAALAGNTNEQINASHLTTALSSYATTTQLNALEYLNQVIGGEGFVTLKTNKNSEFVVDITHEHSWFEILDRPDTVAGYGIVLTADDIPSITKSKISDFPTTWAWSAISSKPTTISGYGITDAKIDTGIITLGSNTITPVTSVGLSMPTGFSISGSPVTKNGTLIVGYASGYEGFTTALKNKIEALYSWFEVDENGNVKTKDYTESGQTKHRGFWSASFISALGQGTDGGGGGQGDVTWALLADGSDNRQIAISHLTTALSGYATETWVNNKGYLTQQSLSNYYTKSQTDSAISTALSSYATTSQLNALEFVNQITGDDEIVTFTTNKSSSFVIDFSHEHSFFELTDKPDTVAGYGIVLTADDIPSITKSKISDFPTTWAWSAISNKPTTVSGYGITDAKIESGVITLGSGTITPVTSVAMSAPTGFSVSGSPVTKTGTLALTYASGYEGFTTTLKNRINTLWAMFTREGSGTAADPYVIKANYGLYTDSFLSALGLGSDGGGGGVGDVTWDLLANNSDTRQIALSHLTTALSGYATQSWVNSQGFITSSSLTGYATQAWVQQQGYLTTESLGTLEFFSSAAGDSGVITLTTNKGAKTDIDITHQHSWHEILDKPDYLGGYGIVLTANDIPSITKSKISDFPATWAWSNISGKPTTLDGYGITGGKFSGNLYILGNVGIGTTSPSYKLSVNGDVSATNFRGAFIGNASSATKLQTARTIWGQNFDGTANVSGAITGATTITASSNVSVGGTLGVTGAITASGNATIGGDLTVNGGDLTVNEPNASGASAIWFQAGGTTYGNLRVKSGNGEFYFYQGGTSSGQSSVCVNAGEFYSYGAVTALSDARDKNVIGDVSLTIEQIANAPAIRFMWNDGREDKSMQAGSIAQYWHKVLPEVIREKDDRLSLSYGVAALVSSIITARKVVDHERRIAELERENKELKMKLKIA